MIAITGGGTGGHIFPNISIIEELKKRGREDIFWIGEKHGKEQGWAEKVNVPFYGINTGKLRRYFSLKNITDVFRVIIGIFQSLFILLKLKPDVLFSKGGFVSVPPVLAAWILRIPVVTHESDINPGLATKIISRFASVICVSFEKTRSFFSKKNIVHTGNPVRDLIRQGEPKKGLKFLNFSEDLPIVLIVGGSLGASSINQAVREMLELQDLTFNVVHQCGQGNYQHKSSQNSRYRQFEFIDKEIGDVMAASDIVVSRAGAGAIYEIGYLKRPSILVPLPKSKSRGEQIENALYFEENGASRIISDEHLNGNALSEAVNQLLTDRGKLRMMMSRAGTLCKYDAEKKVADVIIGVCKNRLINF